MISFGKFFMSIQILFNSTLKTGLLVVLHIALPTNIRFSIMYQPCCSKSRQRTLKNTFNHEGLII